MAEAKQQYKPMHPIMRSMQKQNARMMLAKNPPAPDPVADAVADVKKNLESVLSTKQMTPEKRQAIAAGAARAWYADLPGAATDIAGMMLNFGVEGLKYIMPSNELTGYDLNKELIDPIQEGARNPFLGSKQLEEFGENAGYIPPTTGTDEEFNARMLAGIVDPVPVPMTAGVFASNRAKNLPKMSLAKAEKMETARKDPQDIFLDTGFFRGPEGEWRFEISDVDLKINQEFLKTKTDLWGKNAVNGPGYDLGQTYGKLSDAIDHPELFKAYPELEDVYLKIIPPGSDIRGMSGLRGSYNDAGEMVPINSTPLDKEYIGGFKNASEESDFNAAIGEKVPEKFAKVIMVVAPTRQKSIQNLQFIVDEASTTLSADFARLRSFESNPHISKDELGYHTTMREYKNNINRTQEKIKENLPELERLKAGGQPDLEFSVKSTLTHEIQHAIQRIEGLPQGGSPQTAYRETQDAAIAPILEKAKQKDPKLFDKFALSQEVAKFDNKMQNMAMMDDVRYLQQLQKFIMSDTPTRNAKFVENTSFSYGLTQKENNLLGVRPSKRKTKEYADYLRKKARLFQDKVIDKYLAGPQGKYSQKQAEFRDLLGRLYQYTEKAGAKAEKMPVDLAQYKADSGLSFFRKGNAFDPQTIGEVEKVNGFYAQPNWLALGEKNIKNYVKRLARDADNHREAAGMNRQIESKLTELENQRRQFNSTGKGSDYEFYQRLAGEAEARAVQERLELADVEAGGWGSKSPEEFDPTKEEWLNYGRGYVQEEGRKVPTDLYDVPLNELAFTGRTPAAKTQAKSDAQAILNPTMKETPAVKMAEPKTISSMPESITKDELIGMFGNERVDTMLQPDIWDGLEEGIPTRLQVFHGKGKRAKYAEGVEGAALGDGRYSALKESDAKEFGDVTPLTVELKNPAVLTSDADLHTWFGEPAPRRNDLRIPLLKKTREKMIERGHDGVIINVPGSLNDFDAKGRVAKRLNEIFEVSQVIEFKPK